MAATIVKGLYAVGSLLLLSACQTAYKGQIEGQIDNNPAQPAKASQMAATPAIINEETIDTIIQALPQQSLNAGQCGLFLFEKGSQKKLIFFSPLSGERLDTHAALMNLGGQLTQLKKTDGFKTAIDAFPAHQTFVAPLITIDVTMEISVKEGITQGAVIETASLRLTEIDEHHQAGWSTIKPSAGLIACQ